MFDRVGAGNLEKYTMREGGVAVWMRCCEVALAGGVILATFTLPITAVVSMSIPVLAVTLILSLPQLVSKPAWSSGSVWASCFIAMLILSLMWAEDFVACASRVGTSALGFLLYLRIKGGIKGRSALEYTGFWLRVLSASGVVMAVQFLFTLGLLSHEGIGVKELDRSTGGVMSLTWGASNTIAAALLITCVSAIACSSGIGKRRVWIPVGLCIVVAILATFSRTVIVLITSCCLLVLLLRGGFRGTVSGVLLITLSVVLLAGIIGWDMVMQA
ncbi:MAG: hypothetical protein MN733_28725, partial [Nitrososphaera sp.]|nr:hypothetical protein [Nitrososphaera sp.]